MRNYVHHLTEFVPQGAQHARDMNLNLPLILPDLWRECPVALSVSSMSVSTYLLSAYYVQDTVYDTEQTERNKTGKNSWPCTTHFLVGESENTQSK